jgi:hypothetical protein
MIEVICKRCRKKFITHFCWTKRGRGKYCSLLCKYKDSKKPIQAIKKRIELSKLGLLKNKIRKHYKKIMCKHCNKVFYTFESEMRKGGGKFCSRNCYFLWKKGKPNGLKGYKWSEERRKTKSEQNKIIGLIPPILKGENHPNWKGVITPINEKIRKSNEYKEWREKVYERDNYTCIFCGYRGNKLSVDHIKPFSLFPELRLDISNGRTLCQECHKATETYGWNFYNRNIKIYRSKQ